MPILCDLRINGMTVATVVIRNDRTGNTQIANYDAILTLGPARNQFVGEEIVATTMARVEEFDRSLGVVELLRLSLNALHEKPWPKRSDFESERGG